MMDTPVALFVFNRPGLTRDALDRLARIRPRRLLIIADGPRSREEEALCAATRRIVRQHVGWDAEVDVLESERNLGCRRRFESGLDWVFELVDRAIILEDDIEVGAAFVAFAASALDRMSERADVRMIAAHNALVRFPEQPQAFLARTGSIWGWATWADRWQTYRRAFDRTPAAAIGEGIARHAKFGVYAKLQHHLFATRLWERIDTWDMPWSIWNLATGGYCLTVPRNQARNHGVGPGATHTTADDDLRGALPLLEWAPESLESLEPPVSEAYDRGFTLLELVLNYEEPRRWKVLAGRRGHLPPQAAGPGWDVMLGPFDHAKETARLIAHLRRLVPSRQLDRLAEVFPPS